MKISIRSKLILAISGLMVLVFSMAAHLFIEEKKVEMAEDIYLSSLAYVKLVSPRIIDDYETYLAHNGFVYFNRDIQSIFAQSDYIDSIRIVTYSGEILYDSREDKTKKYDGEKRTLRQVDLFAQVRSENISFNTLSGRVIFIKENEDGNSFYVNSDENRNIIPLEKGFIVGRFVVPSTEKYAVVYEMKYDKLYERINDMIMRIVYLAIFGVMIGMLMSFLMSQQITKPVADLVDGVNQIAKGNFEVRVDIKSSDEIKFLGDAVNKMASDLELSTEAKIYQARMGEELKIAMKIQKQLIPNNIPKVEGLDISAGIVPAEEIGGDIYDFLPKIDGKQLMYLGDVTGHGVPAGIVSSIASALFYGYGTTHPDLMQVMNSVNRVLKAKTMTNMFMTLCLLEWDENNKKLMYVSAGHEQMIHYKAKSQIAELAPSGGIALGMIPDVSKLLKIQEINMEKGDYVVLYSDGIPESWNTKKELYGMERFVSEVAEIGKKDLSATNFKNNVLVNVKKFSEGFPQADDITMIVLKRV